MFVKIKNWASCIPEEVRKKDDFMPIYAFEKLVNPPKVPSPFVGTTNAGGSGVGGVDTGAGSASGGAGGVVVKGPGGIGEPLEKADGERTEGGGTGRKRTRRNPGTAASTTAEAGSSAAAASTATKTGVVPPVPQTPGVIAQGQIPKGYVVPTGAAVGTGATGTGSGDTKDRTMLTAAGALTVPPIVDKLPPEMSCVSAPFLLFFPFPSLSTFL